jgi:hypothetical protein
VPLSRTFIPAKLSDNRYQPRTDYRAVLHAMPEPLRSKMLFGDFKAGREDNAFQVIPSEWVDAAQKRWSSARGSPLCGCPRSASTSPAAARTRPSIAPRYENWFAELQKHPGKSTPDGPRWRRWWCTARATTRW